MTSPGGLNRFARGTHAGGTGAALAHAFEREVDAIAHDSALGVEVVQWQVRSVARTTQLSLTLDRPGGVDLSLCERIAARINANLAGSETPYSLEVESAGLVRPLLRPADFQRFAGERVRILTTLALNGAKTHRGTLRGLRGDLIVLESEKGELLVPAATVKSANLEFDPRADLQRDKRQRKQSHGNSRHGT